ncbi:GNAT family N-acetyltransferase [Paenibacillus koleovorans]|uniref:GNAT family N-acetyltransferase n=1 Tax=Paenibacillus koleovorans TaxID=121608 RepID=UPI000FD6C491|nr:GNAT family protein [Paenibacillus koleovorans]
MRYWTGKTIRLRAIQPKDAELFDQFDDEVDLHVDQIQFPQSKERTASWLESQQKTKLGDAYRFIAELADGTAVGTIDTFACQRRHGTFKYGVAVARPFRGHGYAAEMIILVLTYYFQELGYQKATPHVYSFNEASIRLHERLGFTLEGRLRNMIYTNGRYFDELHYGMTIQEFRAWHGGSAGYPVRKEEGAENEC